jgi:two-component system cell cycle response regulator DivK
MKKLILLVEDNEDILQLTQLVLKTRGYEVAVAKNGLEAVEKAMSELPDLILMDLFMPVMDGIQATARIRSNAKTKDIPIVALTASARPNDRERSLAAGCDDFIAKPYTYHELIGLIENRLTDYIKKQPAGEVTTSSAESRP